MNSEALLLGSSEEILHLYIPSFLIKSLGYNMFAGPDLGVPPSLRLCFASAVGPPPPNLPYFFWSTGLGCDYQTSVLCVPPFSLFLALGSYILPPLILLVNSYGWTLAHSYSAS